MKNLFGSRIIQTFVPGIVMILTDLGKRMFMETMETISVLFDFDGVVVDTETQYSIFWHKIGVNYLGMEELENRVKGQTLTYIYDLSLIHI